MKLHPGKWIRKITAAAAALVTGLSMAAVPAKAEPVYCCIDGCMEEVSVSITPATCTQDGIITFDCPVHGERTEAGASAQHNYKKNAGTEEAADCTHAGTYLTTCIECGDTKKVDDPDAPALGHALLWQSEKAPENGMPGTRGHYACSRCGALFADESGEMPVAEADLVIAAHQHELTYRPAQDPTEEQEGNIAFWICSCGACFADEDGREEIEMEATVLSRLSHALTYVEKKEVTEEEEGCLAHWKCHNCGRLFSDEQAAQEAEPEDLVIARLGHTLVFVPAKEATEDIAGMRAHFRCSGCGKLFLDEEAQSEVSSEDLVIRELGHTLILIPAVAPTDVTPGNIAYYTCTGCGRLFSDTQGEMPIDLEDTVLPALGHTLKEVEAKEPTETESGNIRYFVCTRCGRLYLDAQGMQEISLTDTLLAPVKHVHIMQEVPAKEATETEAGNIRYFFCTGCGKLFADSEGAQELTEADIIIPAKGHIHALQEVPAREATETETGNIRYFLCTSCGKLFADAEGSQELTEADIILPTKDHIHALQEVPAREAIETETGNIRYFLCTSCGKFFADAEGTQELTEADILIPARDHVHALQEVPAREATEMQAGNIRYFLCTDCGKLFADIEGTQELTEADIVISAMGHVHALNEVPAKESTETEAGNIRYFFCTSCGKLFADAAGNRELTEADILIPAKGHSHALKEVPAKEATETEAGNIRYFICDACGKCFLDAAGNKEVQAGDLVTPPTGHTLKKVEGKEPTSSAAGWKPYWICTGCQALFADAEGKIPVTAEDITLLPIQEPGCSHTYAAEVTLPTCTEEGFTTFACTDCQNTYTGNLIPALGHLYETEQTQGSCTEDACLISRCSRCGDEIREVLDAAPGHTITHVKGKPATAAQEGCIEHWLCIVCGQAFADPEGTVMLTPDQLKLSALTDPQNSAEPEPSVGPSPAAAASGLAPKTGDETSLGLSLLTLGAGLAAITFILMRRRKAARAAQ